MMYMNPEWTERSLLDEIRDLAVRIDSLANCKDRKSKHTVSFLKQMAKSKEDQLATLRHRIAAARG